MVMAAGLGKRMRPLTADPPQAAGPRRGQAADRPCLRADRRCRDRPCRGQRPLSRGCAGGASQSQRLALHHRNFRRAAALLETGGGLVKAAAIAARRPDCLRQQRQYLDRRAAQRDRPARRSLGRCSDGRVAAGRAASARQRPWRARRFPYGQARSADAAAARQDRAVRLHRRATLIRRLLADPPEGAFSTMVFWERAIAKGRLFGMSHGGDWFDVGRPASIPLVEAALSEVSGLNILTPDYPEPVEGLFFFCSIWQKGRTALRQAQGKRIWNASTEA